MEESISGAHQHQQLMYSNQKASGRQGQGMTNATPLGVNGSIDQNWGDSGMVMAPDNSHSQHTDTSTDVDTDDKPHVCIGFPPLVSLPFLSLQLVLVVLFCFLFLCSFVRYGYMCS